LFYKIISWPHVSVSQNIIRPQRDTTSSTATPSGKLQPVAFIQLQERSGTFGPRNCEEVEKLPQKFGNVSVTVTKSGKLQKETREPFLDYIIKPYVKKHKFMLIFYSW
jgi:hypothetical protein